MQQILGQVYHLPGEETGLGSISTEGGAGHKRLSLRAGLPGMVKSREALSSSGCYPE